MTSTKDRIAATLALTVCAFVVLSLLVVFVLALNGETLENVWSALFALVASVLAAVGGYLGGQAVTQRGATGEAPHEDEEKSP